MSICNIKHTPTDESLRALPVRAAHEALIDKFGDNLAITAIGKTHTLAKSQYIANQLADARTALAQDEFSHDELSTVYAAIEALYPHIPDLQAVANYKNTSAKGELIMSIANWVQDNNMAYPSEVAPAVHAVRKALVFGGKNRDAVTAIISSFVTEVSPEALTANEVALIGEVKDPALAQLLLRSIPRFVFDSVYNVVSGETLAGRLLGSGARMTIQEALHSKQGYLSKLVDASVNYGAGELLARPNLLSKLGLVFQGNGTYYNEKNVHEVLPVIEALKNPEQRAKIFSYIFPTSQNGMDEVIEDNDMDAETISSKLNEHIQANDTKDASSKMSATVKGFSSTFVHNGIVQDPKFIYIKLLQAFNGIDLSSRNALKQIKLNLNVKKNTVEETIYQRIANLATSAEVRPNTELNFINILTESGQAQEGKVLVVGKDSHTVKGAAQYKLAKTRGADVNVIVKKPNEITTDFLKRITRVLEGMGKNDIHKKALLSWDYAQASSLLTDLVVHFGSQARANYMLGVDNNYIDAGSTATGESAVHNRLIGIGQSLEERLLTPAETKALSYYDQVVETANKLLDSNFPLEAAPALQNLFWNAGSTAVVKKRLTQEVLYRAKLVPSIMNAENRAGTTSVVDMDGKKRYLYFNGTFAYHQLELLMKGTPNKAYQQPFMQANPFVKDSSDIQKVVTHLGSRNSSRTKKWGYTDPSPSKYWQRTFVQGFLSSKKRGNYVQNFGILSDRPRAVGVQIPILTGEKEYKARIQQIIDQLALRPDFNKERKEGNWRLAKPKNDNFYDLTHLEASLKGADLSTLKAADVYDKFLESVKKEAEWNYGDMTASGWEVKMEDVLQWTINHQLNGYFVNQLVTGDQAYFKSQADVLKRIALAFSPGERGRIGEGALKPTYKVAVLEDVGLSRGELSAIFSESNSPLLHKELTRINEAGEVVDNPADLTDAQSFILPERHEDLLAGYGVNWNMGNILKPIHYGLEVIDASKHKDDGTGKPNYQPMPVALKQSAVVLTDELCLKYPPLGILRANMRASAVEEAMFNTATKLGNVPKSTFGKVINPDSILELDQNNYLLQMNPMSKLNKKVTAPSQMMYFMNVFHDGSPTGEKNQARATRVYERTAKLLDLQVDMYEQSSVKNGMISRDKVRKSLEAAGERGFHSTQLLKNGLTYNMPSLTTEIVKQIASQFNKSVLKIKFPGAKLVLQSSVGTTNPATGEKLQYKQKDGKMYAEVLVSKKLADQIKVGDHIVDMFGFRIPSTELHSGLPLKVVGYTDEKLGSNIIIAPAEIVPIHGSDYDVDSLFVIRREYDSEGQVIGASNPNLEEELLEIIQGKDKKAKAQAQKLLAKLYKNQIAETFIETLSDMDNIQRMSKPISLRYLQDTLTELGSTKASSFDLATAKGNRIAFTAIMAGRKLTGIFANSIKVYAYLQHAGPNSQPSKVNGKPIVVNGKTYNQIQTYEENGTAIVDTMDALVNAAIDNAKELLLDKLNATDATGNLYAAALSLGVPFKDTVMLFANPYIRGITDNGRLADKTFEEEAKNIGGAVAVPLTSAILEKAYKTPSALTNPEKAALLEQLENVYHIGQGFFTLSSALRILRDVPVEFAEYKALNDHWAALGRPLEGPTIKVDFPLEIDNLFENQPHIEASHKAYSKTVALTRSSVFIHNPVIEEFCSHVAKKAGLRIGNRVDDHESIETIKTEFISYLLAGAYTEHTEGQTYTFKTVSGVKKNEKGEEVTEWEDVTLHDTEAWVRNTQDKVKEVKKKHAGNLFVQYVDFNFKTKKLTMTMDSSALTAPVLIDMQNAFRKLPANIREDLVVYSIVTEGADGHGKLSKVIPAEYYKVANNKLEAAIKGLRVNAPIGNKLQRISDHFTVQLVAKHIDKASWISSYGERAIATEELAKNRTENGVWYDLKYTKKADDTPNAYFPMYIQKRYSSQFGDTPDVYIAYKRVGAENNSFYYQQITRSQPLTYTPYKGTKNYNVNAAFNPNLATIRVRRKGETEALVSAGHNMKVGDMVNVVTSSDITRSDAATGMIEHVTPSKVQLRILENAQTPIDIVRRPTKLIELSKKQSQAHTKETLQELVTSLEDRFSFMKVKLVDSAKMLEVSGREAKGFVKDNVAYINTTTATLDTPFHEFAHPIVEGIKQENSGHYEKLAAELDTNPVYKKVYEDVKQRYAELDYTQAQLEAEAIVELIGRFAAREFSLGRTLMNFLSRMRDAIRSFFSPDVKSISLTDLSRLNIEDIGRLMGRTEGPKLVLPAIEPRGSHFQLDDLVQRSKRIIVPTPDSNSYKVGNEEYERVSSYKYNFATFEQREADPNEDPEVRRATDQVERMRKEQGKTSTEKVELDGGSYTIQEAIARIANKLKQGAIRGKLIHKLIQIQLESIQGKSTVQSMRERDKLYAEAELNPKYYEWVADPENFAKLLAKSGTNVLQEADAQFRDKVESELAVGHEGWGLFGQIDQLVEHADGKYSITDYKAGVNFGSKLYTNIMKYGNQAVDIHSNGKDQAKLQVLLYAMLVKAQQPEATFRHLRVLHIPNEYALTNVNNPPLDVEVTSYVKMVEMYLKNEQPEVYQQLRNESPNIFNPSHYSAMDANLHNEIAGSNESIRSIRERKQAELATMIARKTRDGVGAVSEKAIIKLTKEVAELNKRRGLSLTLSEQDAVSVATRWLGTLDDVNDPYIKTYKKLLDQQTLNWRNDVEARSMELERLMSKSSRFSHLKKGIKGRLQKKSSADLWGWAWTERKRGEGDDIVSYRAMVTENDTEWAGLSKEDKAILTYLREQFKEGVEVLNEIGLREEDGTTLTKLELWQKSKNFKFEYTDDFVPRIPPGADELVNKHGSKLGLKYWKHKAIVALTDMTESEYEDRDEENYGLRVKYMGSPQTNGNPQYYSDNMEVILDRFMRSQLGKKHLDETYAFGKGLEALYEAKVKGDGTNMYDNTIGFLRDKIKLDLLNEKNKSKLLRKGFVIGTHKGKTRRLDYFKLISGLKSAVAAPIMWLQPGNATVNAAVATFMASKEGIVGSAAKRFAGVNAKEVNYTTSNFFAAEAEVTAMAAAHMRGGTSKADTIIKMFDFMPTNYDWAAKASTFVSMNRTWVNQSDMYLFHTLGEEMVAGVTLIAQLKSMKVDKPGHAFHGKSIYDMYEEDGSWKLDPDTGKPFVRGGVEIDGEVQELTNLSPEEINRLYRVYQRMQGGYRGREKTAIEAYLLGQVVMQFRRWLPSFLKVNFGSKVYDESMGYWETVRGPDGKERKKDGQTMLEWIPQLQEGRWRTIGRHLGNWMGLIKSPEYNWDNLSAQQRMSVLDGYVTASMLGTLSLVALGVAKGLDLDEEDPYNKLMWKTISRSGEFYNPIELVENLKSPPPLLSQSLQTMEAAWETSVALSALTFGDHDAAFTQTGRLHGSTKLIRSLPFLNSAYHMNQFMLGSAGNSSSDIAQLLAKYR